MMTSRGIPYFRFYPTDFMHGVRGLSAQEVGVYTMILCRIYEENGPVEHNALRLATYCGMRVKTFSDTLDKLVALGKLTVSDGMVHNRRASTEISSRANDLKNNSKAGKASAKKRQQKQRMTATVVQRQANHTDTDTDTDKEKSSVPYGTDADGVFEGGVDDDLEGVQPFDPPRHDPPPQPPPVDLGKVLFDAAISVMGARGVSASHARSMAGRWLRDGFSREDLIAALDACRRDGAADPIPWMNARLAAMRGARVDPRYREETDFLRSEQQKAERELARLRAEQGGTAA